MCNAAQSCATSYKINGKATMSDEIGSSDSRASLSVRGDYTRRGKRRRRKEFVIFSRDEFRCVYCGKSSVEDGVKLEADHVVARSAGGLDTAGNLVTSCRGCNRSKFDEELLPETRDRLLLLAETRNRSRRISGDMPVDLGRSPTGDTQTTAKSQLVSAEDSGIASTATSAESSPSSARSLRSSASASQSS